MRRISRNLNLVDPPFCSPRRSFYKAFLRFVLTIVLCGMAAAAGAQTWDDFLGGRIDLDAALAAETRQPGQLVADLESAVAAGGPDAAVAGQILGVLYLKMGRPTDAVPVLEKALEQFEASDPLAATFCHLHLGRAHVPTRQVEAAADHLNLAHEAATRLNVPLWIGHSGIALSVLDRWAMDLDSSMAHRQTALQAYESIGYLKGMARARHYIGTIHVFRGELTLALQILQEALATAREAEFGVEIAGSLTDLAGVNFLLGDFDRALVQYEEAAALTGHPWRRGQLSNNLGALLADQGRHEEAIPHFESALEMMRQVGDQRLEAEILLSLGRSQYELKDFDAGVANLDSSLSLAREFQIPMTEAYALQYKGCAMLDQDRLEEAVIYLDQAEALATQTGFFDIREACHWARALVARKQADPQAALERLSDALAIVNDVRRLSSGSSAVQTGYFSQTRKTFDELVDVLYELHQSDPQAGYDEQALSVVQQAKARSFLDQLQEAEVELRSLADPVYQQREQSLLEKIAALEESSEAAAQIAELENELHLLEAELRQADPRYAELRFPRSCTLVEAQTAVLRDGELVLEYHLGKKASYLWSIGRNHFGFHQLPAAESIERQVDGLLPMLRDYNLLGDDAAYFTAQVEPLSETLLGPIAADLEKFDHLIVAADGAVHTLPFSVLLTEKATSRRFTDLPYLVRTVDLTRAPSLSALQRLRSAASEESSDALLILARPRAERVREAGVFARAAGVEALAEVPFAVEEIAGITASFDPALVTLLEAGDATAEQLQSAGRNRHRFVHFTTHGLFNAKRPLYSGLVLEPGPTSDSFLAVNEIFGLSLDCDQVVLSACSSALGRQVGGEGLVGMTRAFLYAGAGSVMAALWDVAGSGTASFMAEYYRQGTAPERPSGSVALAATQRRMIDEELLRADGKPASHPAFWAPFVITGDR